MMEEKDCMDKVDEMLTDHVIKMILDRVKSTYRSGAVDTCGFENDYILPKLLLKDALRDVGEEIMLPSGPHLRHELEYLKHF